MKEQDVITLSGFTFDRKWFHSAGLARIDTREESAAKKEVEPKNGGELYLQLNLITPEGKVQVISLHESREAGVLVGEPDDTRTVRLYISLLEQVGIYITPEAKSLLLTTYAGGGE